MTPSHEITRMNHGQGFLANLVTVFLVVITSCWGAPVFTTHVSRSSLFGLGIATHQGKRRTIHAILASWLITLPLSAMLPAIVFGLS